MHVLAQGTGQALQTAARDDADLVLVHDPEAEQKFIAAGNGIDRRQIAWNDFIVVGSRCRSGAYRRHPRCSRSVEGDRSAQAPFVSRGDKSGTDALEHRLWHVAEIDPAKAGGGSWYRDIGGGMGAALNAAQAMNAYTISDRGTWLSFGNKGDLAVLVEGDPRLLNRYDAILLNPAKHPVAKQALAKRFVQWLVSPEGQRRLARTKSTVSSYFTRQRQLQNEPSARARWRSHQSPPKPNRPQAMPRLTLRIDFDGGRAVGPGKIKLMEMIDKHGSISEAGRQMGMSYRQAWLLVDSLNRSFRIPLVAHRTEANTAAVRL